MSPKLADEARKVPSEASPAIVNDAYVVAFTSSMKFFGESTLELIEERTLVPAFREAARRELLRRSLAVGVKGVNEAIEDAE